MLILIIGKKVRSSLEATVALAENPKKKTDEREIKRRKIQ